MEYKETKIRRYLVELHSNLRTRRAMRHCRPIHSDFPTFLVSSAFYKPFEVFWRKRGEKGSLSEAIALFINHQLHEFQRIVPW
jgi:hypothetical protein